MELSKDRKNRIPAGVGGPKMAHSAGVGASVLGQRQTMVADSRSAARPAFMMMS